jgi:putative transposon-encoded protein
VLLIRGEKGNAVKVILEICNKLIPIGSSPMAYETPIINGDDLIIDHLVKTNGIRRSRQNSYFKLYQYGNMFKLYECDDNRTIRVALEFDVNDMQIENIINGKYVILSTLANDVITLSKYRIEKNDLCFREKIEIHFDEQIKLFSNGNEIDDATDFFNNSAYVNFEHHIKSVIMHNTINCIALKDFQLDYFNFLHDCSFVYKSSIRNNATYTHANHMLEFWSHIYDEKFCYLFEATKRRDGSTQDLIDKNPIYSGQPYRDVRNAAKVSQVSLEIIKEYFRYQDSDVAMDLFAEMEADKRIGVNGIRLIRDINLMLQNIERKNRDCRIWDKTMFGNISKLNEMRAIINIMDEFDISLKTLMSRAVKSIFTEGLSISEYIHVITDYVAMRNELNMPTDTKLPKNIVELHDALAAQMKDVASKEKKKRFILQANINKSLVDSFNEINHDPQFTIFCPMESQDLIDEGQKMHHCVGSYVQRVIDGYSKIYFVRRKSAPDLAFVTIELDNQNNLIQAKAKFNCHVPTDVQKYIDEFVDFAGGNRCD